jgi:tetraacyldisaccharide 4'-kinase
MRWLYEGAMGLRNWLYDIRLLRAGVVDARVIAVGNVTVGGTGKTPVTLALIELLQKKKHTVGVISRGYKRGKSGIHDVGTEPRAAQDFGDEPALIKATYPEVPVVVGNRRIKAARKLLDDRSVDFIVCDDAYQHRALHRDLNLLLLDATAPMKEYRVLPVGRGRESLLPALRRADYILVTKTNIAPHDQVQELLTWIRERVEKPVLRAPYEFRGLRNAAGELVGELRDLAYLVSGVAKPWTVEKTLDGHVKIVKHKSFPDHHRYTNLEVETILDEASHLQARWIITTAKDAVKLRHFRALQDRLWVIDVGVKFEGEMKEFYADIDRLARARD